MKRVLAVLNLLFAGGTALLLYPLFRMVTGEGFFTPAEIGVIGGADGPTSIFFVPSSPVAGLVLGGLPLALLLCNAVVLWHITKSPKEARTDD